MSRIEGMIKEWCDVKGWGMVEYKKNTNDQKFKTRSYQGIVHAGNIMREDGLWVSFSPDDKVTFRLDNNVPIEIKKE